MENTIETVLSQRSLDGAKLAERNPGPSLAPRIPASGLHPGYGYPLKAGQFTSFTLETDNARRAMSVAIG